MNGVETPHGEQVDSGALPVHPGLCHENLLTGKED